MAGWPPRHRSRPRNELLASLALGWLCSSVDVEEIRGLETE